MAEIIGIPVAAIKPGTMRKPPPIPKNPERAPTPTPIATSGGASRPAEARVSRTSKRSARVGARSIATPITIIRRPKAVRSLCPSTSFATLEPAAAPIMPEIVKTNAHGHLTLPRSCECWRSTCPSLMIIRR